MQLIRCISIIGSYLCCLSLISAASSTQEAILIRQASCRQPSRKTILEMPVSKRFQQFEFARRGVPKRREGGGTRLNFPGWLYQFA